MSTQTETSLRVTRVVNANRETVFEAFTDPAQLKRWFCPEGIEVGVADCDVRVGGKYHVRMDAPDGNHYNTRGEYREIDPPGRIVFTWRWDEEEHDTGETLVEIDLNEMGNSTEVILTHGGFPNVESRDKHTEGWTSCLHRLESLCS